MAAAKPREVRSTANIISSSGDAPAGQERTAEILAERTAPHVLTLNKAMNYWRQPPPADRGSERTAGCIVPESADTPASEVPPSSRIIPLDTGAQF